MRVFMYVTLCRLETRQGITGYMLIFQVGALDKDALASKGFKFVFEWCVSYINLPIN